MKIMPIKFQKYQVRIKLEINGEIFQLKALLDTGSDMNLVHKDLIPSKYWLPSNYSAIGLGNVNNDMNFEIPKGILLFDEYALGMKYLLTDLPMDCILGTPFLSAVEPHGSYQNDASEPRYFITLSSINGYPPKRKELPFISESHAQIAYCSKSMVIINTWDDYRNAPSTEYLDDNTDWEIYKENWVPQWQLRCSEGVEFGLPGFSRNTSIHVIPPQHVIGQMHQASTIASRQKLVEMGDLTRVRSANRNWFCQQTQTWQQTPAWNFFQINRMRTLQSWPNQDPHERLFEINYFQYKAMWYNVCLWIEGTGITIA